MTTITITDPHHIDGDPHEVAATAGEQADNALEAAAQALLNLRWAARGAWMTAEEYRTGDMPKSWLFDDTPQGKRLNEAFDTLQAVKSEAKLLAKAAAYNPRAAI